MLKKYFPILQWVPRYNRDTFVSDLIAAVIVTIMLIPQSLAYALLAGLPPEAGLYASILPIIVYAIFGTSMTIAVGPVAVASLMTATAASAVAAQGTPEYAAAAIVLAFLSGLMLAGMGLLRLGFLANFLSHPVISGFITASAFIIAAGQLKSITGIPARGHNLVEILENLWLHLDKFNWATFAIGLPALIFIYWSRKKMKALLISFGLRPRLADVLTKAAPVFAILVSIAAVRLFDMHELGVSIVGDIPNALPKLALPPFDLEMWGSLAVSALLISILGYVETISVAQTLAARRRERVDPDQEMIALGAANIASAISRGFPVTGGFSRSVVNFDAGARTPAAGAFTAVGIALATLYLTPFLYFLPKATLGATIIVAVLSLVDFGPLKLTWKYSKADFSAILATIVITLTVGVEAGVLAGVLISLFLYLKRTSTPHYAIVGRVPGTEHFRNVLRHKVETLPHVLMIRVDESLYFPNARFLEELIYDMIARHPEIRHVVLVGTAINHIDTSALESLEQINSRLKDAGVTLHLTEIKGPVMDRLHRSHFLEELTGKVFFTQNEAFEALREEDAGEKARPPAAGRADAAPEAASAGGLKPSAA